MLRLMGVAVLLACCVAGGVLSACRVAVPAGFEGERAMADLRDLVAIGPRPSGSPGAERARTLIRDRLRQAGWSASEHAFSVQAPDGRSVSMINVIGSRRGERPRRILLGTHYDTKAIEGKRFLGANDGASGVALLLEVARTLGRTPGALGVDLFFFDGEEAFGENITPRDGLYGSNALAAKLAGEGAIESAEALVLVDMIGDRDLNVGIDSNSEAGLLQLVRQIASEQGDAELFDPAQSFALVDDHLPFRDRGLARVLALIDFQYGAKRSPGPLWHTEGDNLQGVSAESLGRVGRVVVELVTRIERAAVQRPDATVP